LKLIAKYMKSRIKLHNCDLQTIKTILKGDKYLSELLEINIPFNWSEFGAPIFQFSIDKINADIKNQKWLTYIPIHIESNTLIGSCGYKGMPDKNGIVEIAYEVVESYRNNGYATEIVSKLIKIAFDDPKVTAVQAHTLAKINASVKVLKKNNFLFIEELEDEEDGPIWKWMLEK